MTLLVTSLCVWFWQQHIYIGNNVSINIRCMLIDCNKITVGNNVLIAPGVQINTSTHPVG